MSEMKQLKPEEYSEARKDAILEAELSRKQKEEFVATELVKVKACNSKKKEIEAKGLKGNGSIYKIACSKCKQEKGVRKEVLDKRIEKFGSMEKLLENYLCRECKKKG